MMALTGALCFTFVYIHEIPIRAEKRSLCISETIICGISSITSFAVSLTKIRKEINELLKKVSVIDELFPTYSELLKCNETFLRIQIISMIAILFITYFNDGLTAGSVSLMFTLCCIPVYICNFIEVVTAAQFVNLVLLLKQKFQILNWYIVSAENLSEHENNSNLWETLLQISWSRNVSSVGNEILRTDGSYQAGRPYNNIHFCAISNPNCWFQKERLRFHALRVIQDVLCDMCESVNSMYGLQILLCMVSAFVEITANISYSIVLINDKNDTYVQIIHKVVSNLWWALTHFLLLFCITGSCNAASREADRSAVLLQKLLLTDLHPATAAEVQIFLQQVINRKVRFTAWDFFTINYTVLGSIVGAITTLLVILVPFQTTK
jgi:hypothetical protein